MSDTSAFPPPGHDQDADPTDRTDRTDETAGSGSVLARDLRGLRRSRSDRVVAGVLGGLGQRLGIDPVILRVVTVVLVFFGGAGVLLYALGWLLVPEEGEEASALDQALGRGGSGSGGAPAVLLALALGFVALVSAGAVLGGSWDGAALIVLAGVGVVLLLRRGQATTPPAGSRVPPADLPLTDPGREDDLDPGAAWARATYAPETGGTAPTGAGWETGPDWEQPVWDPATGTWGPASPLPEPPEYATPAARRARSALGPVTVSLVLVSAGVLAILAATGLTVPASLYLAVALGVVGAGLLVGTWFGRSRGLIALGLVLAAALVPATLLERSDFRGGEDVTVQPTSVEELAGPHEYGAGSVVWDLTALELPEDGEPVVLRVDHGIGDLRVVLPPEVDATIEASVGMGDLRLPGESRGGFGNELSTVDLGPDGPGGGEITLDLDLGVGLLEVTREAA